MKLLRSERGLQERLRAVESREQDLQKRDATTKKREASLDKREKAVETEETRLVDRTEAAGAGSEDLKGPQGRTGTGVRDETSRARTPCP